jgi:hypothetical protein
MRDLTRALEGLREDLAGTQREITVLEQVGRELRAIVDRRGDARADRLIRGHLDEIAQRTAMALARQRSVARMMEECGRERAAARFNRSRPVRQSARPVRSSGQPIAGAAKSP